jgi:hypothetical protein
MIIFDLLLVPRASFDRAALDFGTRMHLLLFEAQVNDDKIFLAMRAVDMILPFLIVLYALDAKIISASKALFGASDE